MARGDGKPKVVSHIYLGSIGRILGMATGGQPGLERLQAQEFGALWLGNLIDQEVGLVELIYATVPRARTRPARQSGSTSPPLLSTA